MAEGHADTCDGGTGAQLTRREYSAIVIVLVTVVLLLAVLQPANRDGGSARAAARATALRLRWQRQLACDTLARPYARLLSNGELAVALEGGGVTILDGASGAEVGTRVHTRDVGYLWPTQGGSLLVSLGHPGGCRFRRTETGWTSALYMSSGKPGLIRVSPDGAKRWQKPMPGIVSSVFGTGTNLMVAMSGEKIIGMDATTGKKAWTHQADWWPGHALVGDVLVLCEEDEDDEGAPFMGRRNLVGIDAQSGRTLWTEELPDGDFFYRPYGRMPVARDMVWLGSEGTGKVYAVDPWTGRISSCGPLPLPKVRTITVVDDSVLCTFGDDEAVAAVDARDRSVRWVYQPADGRCGSMIGAGSGLCYVQSSQDTVRAVDLARGEVQWNAGLRRGQIPGLDDWIEYIQVAEGMVWLFSSEGVPVVLNPTTGTALRVSVGASMQLRPLLVGPVIAGDTLVLYQEDDWLVVADVIVEDAT